MGGRRGSRLCCSIDGARDRRRQMIPYFLHYHFACSNLCLTKFDIIHLDKWT